MFKKILIANRGEIAVRVIAACKELNVAAVAIFSEPDKDSRHVEVADEAWKLEGQPARVYLDIEQIVDIAKRSGAEAVHPGYGFLSENAGFAQACLDAGIKFIGPKPDVISRMGSKVEARRAMEAAGVPVVPGTVDPVTGAEQIKDLGTKFGYPIAIKASAGGGGRGLKVVRSESDVDAAFAGAQREGATYFGNNEVYVEKYLDNPRHIEVRVLGDEQGHVVQLGERDCSSQRRHQKLVEETPAANLDDRLRKMILDSAVRGARSLGYTSAGTLEFLVQNDQYYFLEVNTRVQVEHPITEITTGIDIVKEQILIASGQPLSFSQDGVQQRGHAIEFRINAEDPLKNFMPSPGTIRDYREPRWPWVRIDSACYLGYQVLPFYDSLLAKLVVWGRDRSEAIARAKVALASYVFEGLSTTIPFHLAILDDPQFIAGKVDTKYVEAEFMKRFMAERASASIATATTGEKKTENSASGNNGRLTGVKERKPRREFEVEVNQKVFKVIVTEVVDGLAPDPQTNTEPRGATVEQKTGSTRATRPLGERPATRQGGKLKAAASAEEIRAPMHGVVKDVSVKKGDRVSQGQKLLIFEAMKMESDVVAVSAGEIVELRVKAGDNVDAGALLVVIRTA